VKYIKPSGCESTDSFVLYHAAGLGVLLDPFKKVQRYFKGHTDDILYMTTWVPPTGG
jgi:hypothetical protein